MIYAFQLPQKLDSDAADDLLQSLRSMTRQSIEIDASNVSALGALCAQVLLSAARQWALDGYSFKIILPSKVFLDDMTLLGLKPHLPVVMLPCVPLS